MSVAGEIAELGYSVPEDVTEAIDQAEAMVFEVAQRRVVDSMSPMRDLLERRWTASRHWSTGARPSPACRPATQDLDERLAGLQKSNLVVVGARPAMGKALALDTPIPHPAGG